MAKTRGLGTVMSFTPSGGAKIAVGRLTSIGEISPDSEELDVTTLDSTGGYREYIQGFKDSGELEVSGYHDGEDGGQAALRAAYDSGAVGAVEIEFPDGTMIAFDGYVKAHSIGSAEVDGAIGFGAVIRITGGVTAA